LIAVLPDNSVPKSDAVNSVSDRQKSDEEVVRPKTLPITDGVDGDAAGTSGNGTIAVNLLFCSDSSLETCGLTWQSDSRNILNLIEEHVEL